ncbi:hypothetical protein RCL_jg16208.t1 [Rhizophagus clarus]|uniref:Uncharacterized protein n=1 Tax=Rhizophagus clarus TaxID=94130 RepID=A0A8H3M9Q8_9GLOM|nr:hypothetical protein RCL_jg16208.t1 [Rhizophagus clarus]
MNISGFNLSKSNDIVPSRKPLVIIPARSSTPELTSPPQHTTSSSRGPSVTIKKEIITQNKKLTEAEEIAISKQTALASNLASEQALASDLFKKNKKNDQIEYANDRPIFKLHIDSLTAKKITPQIKKKTTFTCYA